MASARPVRVFVSYSHDDKRMRDRLETHLAGLKRRGVVEVWYDGLIVPGQAWEPAILEQLELAEVILLLVSADFLASDYVHQQELARALARHGTGDAAVLPVLLKPVHLAGSPIGALQGLPVGADKRVRPITLWRNQEEAYAAVASGIDEAVRHLAHRHGQAAPAPAAAPGRATPPAAVPGRAGPAGDADRRTVLLPADYTALVRTLREGLTDTDLATVAAYYGPRGRNPRNNFPARLVGTDLDSRVSALVDDALRTRSVHVLLDGIRETRPDLDLPAADG